VNERDGEFEKAAYWSAVGCWLHCVFKVILPLAMRKYLKE